MGYIGETVRRFHARLVFEKKLKKSQKNINIEKLEIKNKIDYKDVKVNEFIVDSDVKVSVYIPKNGNALSNYFNNKGIILNKIFINYINDDDGLEKIQDELDNNIQKTVNHPILLFEKDDEIMYVPFTHTERCDMLYIEPKEEICRIMLERIEIVKEKAGHSTLGIPYYYSNKSNSLMYYLLKNEKLYESYEINSELDENYLDKDSKGFYLFKKLLKSYTVENSNELKEIIEKEIIESRISIINYNGELYANKKPYNLYNKDQVEFITKYNECIDCDKTIENFNLDKLTKNLNKKKF